MKCVILDQSKGYLYPFAWVIFQEPDHFQAHS